MGQSEVSKEEKYKRARMTKLSSSLVHKFCLLVLTLKLFPNNERMLEKLMIQCLNQELMTSRMFVTNFFIPLYNDHE